MSDPIQRSQPAAELRVSSEAAGRRAVGYAAVFNTWTTISRSVDPKTRRPIEVREIIKPGAFRSALAANQDVRALLNHDPSLVLGRTTSGTLRLREDDRGLIAEIDLPDTTPGRDTAASMARGDVSQMSFAFLPRPGGETVTMRVDGNTQVAEFVLTDLDVFDVSIVTYPAYKDTSVSLRSGGLTDRQRIACRLAAASARIRDLDTRARAN